METCAGYESQAESQLTEDAHLLCAQNSKSTENWLSLNDRHLTGRLVKSFWNFKIGTEYNIKPKQQQDLQRNFLEECSCNLGKENIKLYLDHGFQELKYVRVEMKQKQTFQNIKPGFRTKFG